MVVEIVVTDIIKIAHLDIGDGGGGGEKKE